LLLGFLVVGEAFTLTLRYFSKAPPLAAIFTCFFLCLFFSQQTSSLLSHSHIRFATSNKTAKYFHPRGCKKNKKIKNFELKEKTD
jgi:hypothetical protein